MKSRFVPLMVLLFACAAHAQENSGPYLGFAVGSFSYENDPIDDSATAYRVVGGYRFSDHLAVEGAWGEASGLEESMSEVIPAIGTLSLNVDGDFEVMTVRVLGMLPFDKVSLLGGVGYYDATLDADISFSLPGVGSDTVNVEDSDDGATLVAGVQFELERFAIRGEYEWFDTDSNVDASTFSLNFLFRF